MRRFTNDYNPDGKQKREDARAAAGHRCIRCGHPYECGKHGKGEWTPCDEQCTHGKPIANDSLGNGSDALYNLYPKFNAGEIVKRGGVVFAQWRILTVHHFTGDKSNDAWWNCLSLCQRCHLEIQSKVDPHQPYFFEHSDWLKPYVAGFYSWKYEGKMIAREEAESRMKELLAYEQKA